MSLTTTLTRTIILTTTCLSLVAITTAANAGARKNAAVKEEVMVFDGADGMLQDCYVSPGSTTSTGPGTASCTTADGQTTECDTNDAGGDASCATIVTEKRGPRRITPNKFGTTATFAQAGNARGVRISK